MTRSQKVEHRKLAELFRVILGRQDKSAAIHGALGGCR